MYDIARPAAFMQVIYILRNQCDASAELRLQFTQSDMGGIGLYVSQRGAAQVVKAVHEDGVSGKAFGRGDLLNGMTFPQPARIAKGLNAALGRNARASEDDNVLWI
jgi:hypothetical protein